MSIAQQPGKLTPRVQIIGKLRPLDSRVLAQLRYLYGSHEIEGVLRHLVASGEIVEVNVRRPVTEGTEVPQVTKLFVPAEALPAQRAYWAATGVIVCAAEPAESDDSKTS